MNLKKDPDPAADNKSGKAGFLVAVALLAVLFLPFALSPGRDNDCREKPPDNLPVRKLVIVSPHWEGIKYEFQRAFSRWTAERFGHATELEWLDMGGTSDAIRYVKSEFTRSPAGINVDLFFGGGVDPYIQLDELDLLLPCRLPESTLELIPPTFAGIEVYDAERKWFGAVLSGFGIIFNRKVCDILKLPEPRTWKDLGNPDYFTWVGSGDPRSSGSVHMAYEIILQAYGWREGWAIITRMCGNTRNFSRAGSQVPKDVAMGEVACGMAIDVYAWRQVAEAGKERIGFVMPEGLTVINPDGIAALKGAPHRELAERFIRFVLSAEGQKLWCLKSGVPGGPEKFELTRMPVIPGFGERFGKDTAVPFDPYKWEPGFVYDSDKGSLRWTILNDLIGATMIDTHEELVSAWRVVKNLSADNVRSLTLMHPPLSETSLLQMAREDWKNPEFRARTRAEWAEDARKRYIKIAESGP